MIFVVPFFGKLLFLGGFRQKQPVFWGSQRLARWRFRGGGLFPTMEYLKNTWLNSVSLSLTLLTHSLAWTGVWKLDPVFFSECLQNVNTHTLSLPFFCPTTFSPLYAPLMPVAGSNARLKFFYCHFFSPFFCLPSSHFSTLHSPAP